MNDVVFFFCCMSVMLFCVVSRHLIYLYSFWIKLALCVLFYLFNSKVSSGSTGEAILVSCISLLMPSRSFRLHDTPYLHVFEMVSARKLTKFTLNPKSHSWDLLHNLCFYLDQDTRISKLCLSVRSAGPNLVSYAEDWVEGSWLITIFLILWVLQYCRVIGKQVIGIVGMIFLAILVMRLFDLIIWDEQFMTKVTLAYFEIIIGWTCRFLGGFGMISPLLNNKHIVR